MKTKGSSYIYGIRAIMTIIVLMFSIHVAAQENTGGKLKKIVQGTVDFIGYVLNDVDTTYIEKNQYNMTFMPEYSYSYEHYCFGTAGQSIGIVPDGRNVMSLNIGWRWLIVGYSFDLRENRPLQEFNTSLYSTRFALDLFYRKGSEGYKVNRLEGFGSGEGLLKDGSWECDGLTTVRQLGAGLCYAFNKRFSYSAALGQSTIQRASAGSFILGAGYNWQKLSFNHDGLDPIIKAELVDELKFKEVRMNDFSISLGYGYNWVFSKNFLAGISFEPAVSYKKARLEYTDNSSLQAGLNMDFMTRAALVYNNNRYYAGASLESHTYCFNKSDLYIRDGFGVLEAYIGFYFWKRKQ